MALWRRQLQEDYNRNITIYPQLGGLEKAMQWGMSWPHDSTLDLALSCYKSAADHHPEIPCAWYDIGRLYRDRGQFLEAASEFKKYKSLIRKQRLSDIVGTQASLLECLCIDDGFSVAKLLQSRDGINKLNIFERDSYVCKALVVKCDRLVEATGSIAHETPSTSLTVAYSVYFEGQHERVRKVIPFEAAHSVQTKRGRLVGVSANPVLVDDAYVLDTSFPFDGDGALIFNTACIESVADRQLYSFPGNAETGEKLDVLAGAAHNYFHFLFDCLGSLAFFPKSKVSRRALVFGNSPSILPFQRELLWLMGLQDRKIICSQNFSGSFLASDLTFSTYPSRYMIIHPHVVDFLHGCLAKRTRKIIRGRRYYLQRRGTRRVALSAVEQQRFHYLLEQFGFITIDPTNLTISQQIELFSECEALMADGGAALSNSLFLPESAKLIMLSSGFAYRDAFCAIVERLGLDFSVVASSHRNIEPKWLHLWSNFTPTINLEALENCLSSKLSA